MLKSAASLIRQNILVILALPAMVALGFGAYAKTARINSPPSPALQAENLTVDVLKSGES